MVATESDDHIHTGDCTWCRQVDSERRLLIRHIRLSGVWVIEPRPSHSRQFQVSHITQIQYYVRKQFLVFVYLGDDTTEL